MTKPTTQHAEWLIDQMAWYGRILTERDQKRARASLPIARMARTPEFRATHPRELTIIAVLPDDTISYLMNCLENNESPAVLAMLTDDGVRLVSLTPEPTRGIPEQPLRTRPLMPNVQELAGGTPRELAVPTEPG